MRALFLFFLLVNAAYFYTHSEFFKDRQSPVILKEKKLPVGVDRLTLLRERGLGVTSIPASQGSVPTEPAKIEKLDKAAQPEPQAESENSLPLSNTQEPVSMVCFTLGPFSQASTAGRTAETISALGVTVNRRQTTQRRPRGYWVYLPAFKTYDAAKKRVTELQKKGLKDMFIMGNGEHKNAVSLGLFKSRSAADDRFEQVKKMGLSVNIETQYRVTKLAWLDMEVPGDQESTIEAISEMAGQIPRTTLTQRKCK
ncbi:SPOR domain-containing protein [Kaarinaea lacus]